MRILIFAKRCTKEILRDPLNLSLGLGFPIVLLLLLSIIQSNIPVSLFEIESLTPAITVFGLSFITLFSASLVSKDRETALLERLYTTPLKPIEFILGYLLPLIPIAIAQSTICYIIALFIGLEFSMNIVFSLLATIPISIFYIALGLLCGSVFNVKQVGGICGGLLTNLSGWLSSIWFDITLLGDTFVKIANLLPFIHCVEFLREIVSGNLVDCTLHILIILLYTVITIALAIYLFLRQMKKTR